MDIYYSQYTDINMLYEHRLHKVSESEFPLHTHPIYEILFIKKGNITYMIEGTSYKIKASDTLIFTRPSRGHSIIFNDSTDYERYLILFDDKALFPHICKKIPQSFDILSFEGNGFVTDLFKKMDFYCKHFDGEELQKLLYNLTEELLYNVFIAASEKTEADFYTENPIIKGAVEYIGENIMSGIRVSDICSSLFITKSHLHHLFIKHLKISPKKYITSKKLAIAQRRLRSGTRPTEVCNMLGFSDYSTFFRDYKSHFGHSPSEETLIEELIEIRT